MLIYSTVCFSDPIPISRHFRPTLIFHIAKENEKISQSAFNSFMTLRFSVKFKLCNKSQFLLLKLDLLLLCGASFLLYIIVIVLKRFCGCILALCMV